MTAGTEPIRRILVLTFYFPPDLSAGSFRIRALVDALLEVLPENVTIDVLTTSPNRYGTFEREAPAGEERGRLRIRRIDLPPHRNGMRDQARSFLRFARVANRLAGDEEYDLVLATSSRLMTAALAAWIARRSGTPVYLDIRDLFVDTIREVLSTGGRVLQPFLKLLEGWTFRTAAHVNLVSPGFAEYFEVHYPEIRPSFFPNGIDEEFLESGPGSTPPTAGSPKCRDVVQDLSDPRDRVTVLYAGNIGEGQGLHTIVPSLARRLQGRAVFRIIGDGGRRKLLVDAVRRAGLENVEVVDPIERERLIREYREADVLFLHLNDYGAFQKVLPSKIFEYAGLGKPIWAGVSGYSARFLCEEVSNVAIFPPCDPDRALDVYETLDIRDRPRDGFVRKFRRRTIMTAMARDVAALLEARVSA